MGYPQIVVRLNQKIGVRTAHQRAQTQTTYQQHQGAERRAWQHEEVNTVIAAGSGFLRQPVRPGGPRLLISPKH